MSTNRPSQDDLTTMVTWVEEHLHAGINIIVTNLDEHHAHALASLISLHSQAGEYYTRCTVRLPHVNGNLFADPTGAGGAILECVALPRQTEARPETHA